MDVILHVGAHRTATTTFQHHIAANRKVLKDARTAYWGPKVTRGGLFRNMSGNGDAILPWQVRRTEKRVAMRVEALRQENIQRLIVSDENFLGNLRGVLEDTRLYPDAGQRIGGFAQAFAGHKLTIGLAIRCYSNWWASALAFRLAKGGPVPRARLREFMVTQPHRWRRVIEDIAKAAPDARIVVWTHEALATAPNRILHALSGVNTKPTSMPILNAAPQADALRGLMGDFGIDPEEFHWPEDGRFMPFEAHEADVLRAQYQDDLTWLTHGAGGLADYIDATSAQTDAPTVEGRGPPDDGEHRYLA